jgi:hypothetical protein
MTVTIRAVYKRMADSGRAVLVERDNGGMEFAVEDSTFWLPLSQISGPDWTDRALLNTTVTITLTDWIAQQKNIQGDDVDLERYEAQPPTGDSGFHRVMDRHMAMPDSEICFCRSAQKAQMIAAALNLTQGKV